MNEKRHLRQSISWPLGKEGNGNNNPHTPTISWCLEKRQPAYGRRDFSIELNGSLDFLEFIFHERIFANTEKGR